MEKAFTLMELMIVVVVIGVITAFAIPSFQKGVERSYERQTVINLTTINAAQEVYKARYGSFWPPVGYVGDTTINGFNANLKLSIIEQGVTYNCLAARCTATRAGKWSVAELNGCSISEANMGVCLYCESGACPTVPYLL